MTKVVIVGDAYLADLSVGGGPIIPPTQPPQPPLGIWGPPQMPPGIWPSPPGGGGGGQPGVPTHPIVIPPDAIGPGVPTHPIFLPVYPSHPIVIPPDGLAPGVPTHPIYLPVYPSHPIVIPPNAVGPGLPEHPIVLPPAGPVDPGYGIDAGLRPTHPIYNPAYPSHPIVIPPEAIVPAPDGKAHVVVYYAGERVTFTVEMPEHVPPTEAAPKAE